MPKLILPPNFLNSSRTLAGRGHGAVQQYDATAAGRRLCDYLSINELLFTTHLGGRRALQPTAARCGGCEGVA